MSQYKLSRKQIEKNEKGIKKQFGIMAQLAKPPVTKAVLAAPLSIQLSAYGLQKYALGPCSHMEDPEEILVS